MKNTKILSLVLLSLYSTSYAKETKGILFLETSLLRLDNHYNDSFNNFDHFNKPSKHIIDKNWCNIWENGKPIFNTLNFNQNKNLNISSPIGILGKGKNVKVINNNKINLLSQKENGIELIKGYGENKGLINILGDSNIGMTSESGGDIINSGSISVAGHNNTAILGKDTSIIKTTKNSKILIKGNNNKGIALNNNSVENNGIIEVLGDSNTGISGENKSIINNLNKIIVSQKNNKGIVVNNNSQGVNSGVISLSQYHSIGIETVNKGSLGINNGQIILESNSPDSFGLVTFGGKVINNKDIIIKNSNNVYTTGIQAVSGDGINNGNILLLNNNQSAMNSAYGGNVINNGYININNLIGHSYGMTVKGNSSGINKGNITLNGSGDAMTSGITGKIKENENVKLFNETNITLNNKNSVAMNVISKSFIKNIGNIFINKSNNIGILGKNQSFIETDKGSNIYIKGDSNKGIALEKSKLINNGNITINGNSNRGIELLNNSSGVNKGIINIQEGINNTGIYIDKTSKLLNEGTIIIKNKALSKNEVSKNIYDNIGINNQGTLEMGKNSLLIADKIKGDIHLDPKITTGNLKDKYALEHMFKSKNMFGNIKTSSPLFTANLVSEKSNYYDVNLKRISFAQVINNNELGNYLEKNYMNKNINNNSKLEFYDMLKIAQSKEEVNVKTNDIFGTKFFPTLEKQTLNFITFNNEILKSNVPKDSLNVNYKYIIGGAYNSIRDKNTKFYDGYKSYLKNIWFGGEKKLSKNTKIGGILGLGQYNSNFENSNHRKDNLYQGTIFINLNKFNMNFNSFATLGQMKTKLQRYSFYENDDLDSKFNNNYYIISNEISKEFKFNNGIYITPQLNLNFYEINQKSIKESNGKYPIKVEKSKLNIIEPKIGITFGKNTFLKNNYILNTKLGLNYFWRNNNYKKNLNEKGSFLDEGFFKLKKEPLNNNDGSVNLMISLEKNDWSIYTNYKVNFESNDNNLVEVGMVYKFY